MNLTHFHITLIIFAIVAIFCRYQLIAARKKLTTEQKGILLDHASKGWQYAIMIALVIGMFILFNMQGFLLGALCFLLLMIFVSYIRISLYLNLKKSDLPSNYLK
ncbi:MAG: hypothetical protein K0U12_03960, partial [Gammaproteobacteria bacterium]|nr:hypothetical protein [Gammaproteobacteria bacterium]